MARKYWRHHKKYFRPSHVMQVINTTSAIHQRDIAIYKAIIRRVLECHPSDRHDLKFKIFHRIWYLLFDGF